jgi:copper chaperone NosL
MVFRKKLSDKQATIFVMKSFQAIFIILCVVFISCKHEMRPIAYGKDNCEQCRMTIMDPQFGAGMLTSKGKVYTFDSGECLFRYVKSRGIHEGEAYYVSDYTNPGKLIDATIAAYLHGDSIQSPMGGHLAAFNSLEAARIAQTALKGEILNWKDLTSKND